MNNKALNKRYIYLTTGVFAMLFSGVLYAWSILKVPFADLGVSPSVLALNFTITMCFFCRLYFDRYDNFRQCTSYVFYLRISGR